MKSWPFAPAMLVLGMIPVILSGCGTDDDGTDTDTDTVGPDLVLAIGSGTGDDFVPSQLTASATDLAAGGSVTVSGNIVERNLNNARYSGEDLRVIVDSACLSGTSPRAEINGPLEFNTGSGDISFRYDSLGCVGEDQVTVRVELPEDASDILEGATFDVPEASVVLNIDPPENLSLSSETPDPLSLAPINAQTDGRTSISRVGFRLLSEGRGAVPEQEVEFELSAQGADENGKGMPELENVSATTDGSGNVNARVRAGSRNAVVRVVARVTEDDGSTIATTSEPVSVSSNIPDVDSFSLSISDAQPAGAWEMDGVTTEITVRAADRDNTWATGAVVNFVTSSGAVEGDCVLDESGECSVTWRSQSPRVRDDGRVTVMARTVGEESFDDNKGSGFYDDGEPFREHRGEPFLDVNQTGSFDSGVDTLFDQNGNGTWDDASGEYKGLACPEDADFCEFGTVPLWNDITTLWMPSENLSVSVSDAASDEYCAEVQGNTRNGAQGPPATGTTVDFSFDGQGDGIISSQASFTVSSNSSSDNFRRFCVEADLDSGDTLTAVATPPADALEAEDRFVEP